MHHQKTTPRQHGVVAQGKVSLVCSGIVSGHSLVQQLALEPNRDAGNCASACVRYFSLDVEYRNFGCANRSTMLDSKGHRVGAADCVWFIHENHVAARRNCPLLRIENNFVSLQRQEVVRYEHRNFDAATFLAFIRVSIPTERPVSIAYRKLKGRTSGTYGEHIFTQTGFFLGGHPILWSHLPGTVENQYITAFKISESHIEI